MNLLQKAILSTIVYYDTLDYPLTSFEVLKYLVNPLHVTSFYYAENQRSDPAKSETRPPIFSVEVDKFSKITLANIRKSLVGKELKKLVQEKNGFYFLINRNRIIRTRINRQKIADQRWKKAKKIIRLLQIIPYLRMVAISGSLAMNNTQKESDIDVLIVIKSNRIWLARFLVTLWIQLLGKRRHKKKTEDRICLNHYITDKSLEIKFRSLYNAQTYSHIIPVLKIEPNIYEKFQKANNWIKDYLVFFPDIKVEHFKTLKINHRLILIAKIGEICLNNKFGDFLEKLLRIVQKKLIKRSPLINKKGGRITVDDTQLEFHPDSPERKILDKYNETMVQLGIKELAQEKDSGLL